MELLTAMNYWGLSYDNIVAMMKLSATDLQKKIVNCMGVPSSFTAIALKNQQDVITCSDIYGSAKADIKKRAAKAVQQAISFIESNPDRFSASAIDTPKAYEKFLQENLKIFFEHYDKAFADHCYSSESLPDIAFADNEFDLAICHHFLFISDKNFTVDFQIAAIKALCRIASEARIYPLLDPQGKRPVELDEIIKTLEQQGYLCRFESVDYKLEKGGDTLLKVSRGKNT
jgi:hypothetical protein